MKKITKKQTFTKEEVNKAINYELEVLIEIQEDLVKLPTNHKQIVNNLYERRRALEDLAFALGLREEGECLYE